MKEEIYTFFSTSKIGLIIYSGVETGFALLDVVTPAIMLGLLFLPGGDIRQRGCLENPQGWGIYTPCGKGASCSGTGYTSLERQTKFMWAISCQVSKRRGLVTS